MLPYQMKMLKNSCGSTTFHLDSQSSQKHIVEVLLPYVYVSHKAPSELIIYVISMIHRTLYLATVTV